MQTEKQSLEILQIHVSDELAMTQIVCFVVVIANKYSFGTDVWEPIIPCSHAMIMGHFFTFGKSIISIRVLQSMNIFPENNQAAIEAFQREDQHRRNHQYPTCQTD